MIELPFTPAQVYRARKKAEKLGNLYNSITGGEGNFAGYLGEIVIAKYIGGSIVSSAPGSAKYKYDIKLGDKTVEVKTKRRTVDPLLTYDASIADVSCHQNPDIYAFVSVTYKKGDTLNPLKVWCCGFITPEEFFAKAKFWKKNTWDRSNGFRVKSDMWNLTYDKLSSIEEVL